MKSKPLDTLCFISKREKITSLGPAVAAYRLVEDGDVSACSATGGGQGLCCTGAISALRAKGGPAFL